MKLLVVGGTGTIGSAVVKALSGRHEVMTASRSSERLPVDMSDHASVCAVLDRAGAIDGLVCTAGQARFKPLADLNDDDFAFCLANKLMGQVNFAREAMTRVRDGGVIVLTSGSMAREPMPGGAAISLVNAAVEGFTRGAALEAPRRIRVNVVSPPWVAETLRGMGKEASSGMPAAQVAEAYLRAVDGDMTGEVIEP